MKCNLSYYDIYSKQIGFFFNNKDKIGTNFGLFLTSLYILISLSLFIYYLYYTINRSNMKVYDSSTFSQDVPIVNINPHSLYFAFGLEDPKTFKRFIDETIYFPKILFFDREKVNGEFHLVKRIELESEPCKEEKFGEEYKNLIIPGELNNSYCLKDFNLTLAGGYKFNKFSYLRIRIYPCVNSTDNNFTCKPQEVIDTYLKGGYFSILTKDIGLNANNISFPVIYNLQNLYTTIDKSIHKDFILYYGITEVRSDMGLFFEDIEIKKYLQFRKSFQSFFFRDESEYYEGKDMCSIDFRIDELIYTQNRKYSKLQEAFSNIGGFMQLASTVFSLISFFTNRIIPALKILNGIFKYNLSEKKLIMKIKSLKELNLIYYSKDLYLPLEKKVSEKNSKINTNSNSNSKKLPIKTNIINKSNNSRNSLIDIPSVISSINKRKYSLFNQPKEHGNFSILNNTNLPLFDKKNQQDQENKQNKNIIINQNYIYRVGSFFPKRLNDDEKRSKSKNTDEYINNIDFNLFQYYILRTMPKIKKKIEIFKIGLSIYQKRMDIINIFTLILLFEKKFIRPE